MDQDERGSVGVAVTMEPLDGGAASSSSTPANASRVYVRGRATGSQNFNASDLERLIDSVEEYGMVPSCTANWQFVANIYNDTVAKFNLTASENSTRVQRHASSLAQRFHRIFTKNAGKKLAECPGYVRRANAIRQESESPEQFQLRQQQEALPGLPAMGAAGAGGAGDPDQSLDASTVSVGGDWHVQHVTAHDLDALPVREAIKSLQDMFTAHMAATQQLFHALEAKVDLHMNHILDQVAESQEHIQKSLDIIAASVGGGGGGGMGEDDLDESGQPLSKKPRK